MARALVAIFVGAVGSTTLFAALGAWITTMVPIASSNQSFFRPDGVYGRIQWWACRAQQVQPTVD